MATRGKVYGAADTNDHYYRLQPRSTGCLARRDFEVLVLPNGSVLLFFFADPLYVLLEPIVITTR